jgi:D-alanyl-D-alanine carboxypeptidase
MKIVFLKISCLLFLIYAGNGLSGLAQTPTPTPSLNIITIPKVQTVTPANRNSLFLNVLASRLAKGNLTIEKFCPQDNILTKRILKDYGAVFVGNGQYSSPCYMRDENVVQNIQNQLGISSQIIGGVRIELQPAAMEALLKAVAEAKNQGLNITPRGGSIAARRSFSATVTLWNSRVSAGLDYWVRKGKITPEQAQIIPKMEIINQVSLVLELEERGIYFSKDFSKSILYSVAAPGTSQHNLMLAFDVTQFSNPRIRQILANNGWFQTVASDLPHFTYLGVQENELPALGLQSVKIGNQIFWIPQI